MSVITKEKQILKYFYSKKKYKYKKMIDTSYKNLKKYHLKRQLTNMKKLQIII